MDYCPPCRRHLNGALACPGCAAYAPDIAPRATDGGGSPTWSADSAMTGGALSATAAWEPTASATWHDGPPRDEALLGSGMDGTPYPGMSGDIEDAPPARQGRAARRRQLARWKKTQRRAVVATAVALVGGGLTVATTDRHSTDQTQATAALDDRSMGAAEEQAAEQSAEQSAEHIRPASISRTTHRPAHTASPAQSPATDLPHQQSQAAPHTTQSSAPDAPGAQSALVPDAALPPQSAAAPGPQAEAAPPAPDTAAPDRSDTAAEQPSVPATTGPTAPGTSQPNSLLAVSPTEVCLLGLCLG